MLLVVHFFCKVCKHPKTGTDAPRVEVDPCFLSCSIFAIGLLVSLLQQLQHCLRQLVRLGQHGGGRLVQDVELGEVHHFLRHVDIADA